MVLGRFLVGVLLSYPSSYGTIRWQIALAAAAWVAAGTAVYVYNGCADLVEDRANGSRRPIASGRLQKREALLFCSFVTVFALTAAAVSGICLEAALYLVLGYMYSGSPWPAKRHWAAASATLAASGAVTFWAAARVTGGGDAAVIVAGTALAAWMGLVGALVKDLSDIEGDRVSGRKTYAIVFPPDGVARCAAVAAILIGLSGAVASTVLAPFLLPAMAALFTGGVIIAVRANDFERNGRNFASRKFYRIFMRTQKISIALTIALGICYATTVRSLRHHNAKRLDDQ